MSPAGPDLRERLAHALTPWEWTGRSLVVGIIALAGFAAMTVCQRALVSDSTAAWVATGLHAAVALVVVPMLSIRAVRRWRAEPRNQPTGVPE